MVRTRFAPSPTGIDAHIGTAYAALLNLAFARKNNGKFIYRLEDTDRERYVPEFEANFKKSMAWLGITWDEGPDVGGPKGPYRQSERLDRYKKYALELVEKGAAYFCFCSKERLEELRRQQVQKGQITKYDGKCRDLDLSDSKKRYAGGESGVVRLKVPREGQTKFVDVVRGEVVFENSQIDDQVLLKSDGFLTYHLAVVVDDHEMEISHVIRAEEWLSSTPKHVLLYRALGWALPIFAHIPILRDTDKSKLSKRKNPVWISWYREQGFLPEAILNFLALQAWSHPEGKEIFNLEEFIDKFSLERLSKTGPAFDLKKLEWLNGEYIRSYDDSMLSERLQETQFRNVTFHYWPQEIVDKMGEDKLIRAVQLVKVRSRTLLDILKQTKFLFYRPKIEIDTNREILEKIYELLLVLRKPWEKLDWETRLRSLAGSLEVKPGDLFMELRIAVSGSRVGPDLFESIKFLGEDEVLARLKS